jgi:predicted ATPase
MHCVRRMQGLAGAPTTTRICLQPFTAQEAAALVAHVFEGTAAPAAFLAQVLIQFPQNLRAPRHTAEVERYMNMFHDQASRSGCLLQAASAIYERSCGLPLFIQEMAVHLRQA